MLIENVPLPKHPQAISCITTWSTLKQYAMLSDIKFRITVTEMIDVAYQRHLTAGKY